MGVEGLLFPCPIFWSAPQKCGAEVTRFPLFVAHALSDNENRTTEGPQSLGESELPVLLSHTHTLAALQDIRPRPNGFFHTDTHASCVFVRTFVHKVYRVCRLPLPNALNLGSSVNRDRNRVYQGRRLIGGAPPRQNQKSYLAGGSESQHQIVIDYEHEEKFQ
ncbi:hypothetical protein DUI87_02406 [Hirundo rustica rustica]|uniref:Uncharacterized protein n=1 Tax=Hirundo rustica rustica TaxID=333673 RepID=A0A3M0LEX6_HIRRU|nr:hypothetical protein DUI87_02406 [Hirundo rustica rustica]